MRENLTKVIHPLSCSGDQGPQNTMFLRPTKVVFCTKSEKCKIEVSIYPLGVYISKNQVVTVKIFSVVANF